jgi:hypothetical protein
VDHRSSPNPAPAAEPKSRKTLGVVAGLVVAGLVALGCGGNSNDSAEVSATPSSPATSNTLTTPPTSAPAAVAATTAAAPTLVVMPDLVGLNAAVASDKLQKLGFTKIQYGSQDAEDKVVLLLTNWTVTKQSIKKGAKVDPTDLVVLTCTKKP